jgi:hypothetical protein
MRKEYLSNTLKGTGKGPQISVCVDIKGKRYVIWVKAQARVAFAWVPSINNLHKTP